jgi:hypothetical protein
MSALRPPTDFAHVTEAIQSSTHSIDGVLIVSPSRRPVLNLPALVSLKIFGSGHAGV